jgi:hypothetical protein
METGIGHFAFSTFNFQNAKTIYQQNSSTYRETYLFVRLGLVYVSYRHFHQYFSYIVPVGFLLVDDTGVPRETHRKSLTNFIT